MNTLHHDWEKEIDKKFRSKLGRGKGSFYAYPAHWQEIKSFINSLLLSQRQQIREEIEGGKKEWISHTKANRRETSLNKIKGYNQALSDILNLPSLKV